MLRLLTVGERLFKEQQKKERKRKILRAALSILAVAGMAPLLAYGLFGWLSPDPIVICWPLCYGGLAAMFFSWLTLKYLWI